MPLDPNRNPSISGVYEALAKLRPITGPTPLIEAGIGGHRVWLKCESKQPVGAFKLRGAWHRLTDLTAHQRAAGVVAFSSGNHAQGVAWAARKLDIPATIVMPADAPATKLEGTIALGARVVPYDRMTQDRAQIAAGIAAETGAVVVPSFDDPWIVEGQGSAGLEAVEQLADIGEGPPDLVVSPCGGGGLGAGLALAIPEARIVLAEPEGWDDMARSLEASAIVPVAPNPPPTLCDALQTLKVSPLTLAVLEARGATGLAVPEAAIVQAMRWAHRQYGLVLEPGGAIALAALLNGQVEPGMRTLAILSGGNVDSALFERLVAGDG